MKPFLASLLAAAIGACPAAATEANGSAKPNDGRISRLKEKAKRFLAGLELETHCRRMLDAQILVVAGTRRLNLMIEGHNDKKPSPKDKEVARGLAGKQKGNVDQATETIDILEAEGVAVAFPEVLHQLRRDMASVTRSVEPALISRQRGAAFPRVALRLTLGFGMEPQTML